MGPHPPRRAICLRHTFHSPCLCGSRIRGSVKAGKELEVHPTPGTSPQTSCLHTAKRSALETGSARTRGELARWRPRGQPGSPRVRRDKGSSRQDPGPCASFSHSPSGSCHVPRSERNPVSGVGPSLHSLLLPSCPCARSPPQLRTSSILCPEVGVTFQSTALFTPILVSEASPSSQ